MNNTSLIKILELHFKSEIWDGYTLDFKGCFHKNIKILNLPRLGNSYILHILFNIQPKKILISGIYISIFFEWINHLCRKIHQSRPLWYLLFRRMCYLTMFYEKYHSQQQPLVKSINSVFVLIFSKMFLFWIFFHYKLCITMGIFTLFYFSN